MSESFNGDVDLSDFLRESGFDDDNGSDNDSDEADFNYDVISVLQNILWVNEDMLTDVTIPKTRGRPPKPKTDSCWICCSSTKTSIS